MDEPNRQEALSACANPVPKDKEARTQRLKIFNIEGVFMTDS
jgi:hypothetical protein